MTNYLRYFSSQGLGELRNIPILKVLLAFLPYAAYLVMFSCNPQLRHATHLDDISKPHYLFLSRVEHTLFFCYPHRLLSSLSNPLFDAVAAVPYLVHFPLPILFAIYLAIRASRRDAFLPYVWCVGWVNFVAVIIQTTFPTAPPWFTDSAVIDGHGGVVFESPSEAGFSRMDRLLGVSIFHGLYSTSPLKFGAFPSLHVALPMVIFLNHPWIGKKFGAFHVVLIMLSAVYITHHYLVDALGGILLACIVRLSILKIWSPFKELQDSKTDDQNSNLLTA
jgi:membrane-associated phospholipid phosphatase